MSAPAELVERFMTDFVDAWASGDAGGLVSYFSDDAVYHNIPLDPVTGRQAIRATLEGFMAMGGRVEVEVLNIVSEGSHVVVERIDTFVDGAGSTSLPMMGIFEIRDGLISAWRDYFDLGQFRRT